MLKLRKNIVASLHIGGFQKEIKAKIYSEPKDSFLALKTHISTILFGTRYLEKFYRKVLID
jgi:hypothetical protein